MEVDDLDAIADLAGAGVSIIAHSYGGGIALDYLTQSSFQGRIVFYEPMNGMFNTVSQGLLPKLKSLVAEGKMDEATVLTCGQSSGNYHVSGIQSRTHCPYDGSRAAKRFGIAMPYPVMINGKQEKF